MERATLRSMIWDFYYVGNYTRAIAAANEYISRFNSLDAYVWNIASIAYKAMGQRKKSLEALNKAIEISPGNSDFHYNMSIDLESQEGAVEALTYLKKLSENLREEKLLRYRIAILEHRTGNKEEVNKLAQRFEDGKEKPFSEFESGVLNSVLSLAGSQKRHKIESSFIDDDEPGPQSLFDTGSLLRVKVPNE